MMIKAKRRTATKVRIELARDRNMWVYYPNFRLGASGGKAEIKA
tara:strand:+ start:664 stop:795 length:132 start_codon:yes stop_codon:yes gene_type:complete